MDNKDIANDYYTSFEDKNGSANSFSLRVCNDEDLEKMFGWLDKKYNRRDVVFRGLKEAKFKNYSHLQRQYKEIANAPDSLDKFYELVKDSIEFAKTWKGRTIEKFLDTLSFNGNYFGFLSILQHYEIPTPLIDFTYNPFVALYFATEYHSDYNDPNDINEFCSLYLINPNYEKLNVYKDSFFRWKQRGIDEGMDEIEATIRAVRFSPFLVIDSNDKLYKIKNNFHIINQDGAFIHNSDNLFPLEKLAVKMEDGYSTTLLEQGQSIEGLTSPKMYSCREIHKSLNKKIRTILKDKYGIDEEFLFPNVKKLKGDWEERSKKVMV